MLALLLFAAETTTEITAATTKVVAADPAGSNWHIILVFFGVMILVFTMPRILRRTLNERRLFAKQCNRELADHQTVKNYTDKIMLGLVEAGREINAQLDTKMRVLNSLVRDAENVATRLEKHLAASEHNLPPPITTKNLELSAAKIIKPISDINTDSESGRWRLDLRKKIELHYHENRTPAEIARLLHLSLSEVNLVIDMLAAREQH